MHTVRDGVQSLDDDVRDLARETRGVDVVQGVQMAGRHLLKRQRGDVREHAIGDPGLEAAQRLVPDQTLSGRGLRVDGPALPDLQVDVTVRPPMLDELPVPVRYETGRVVAARLGVADADAYEVALVIAHDVGHQLVVGGVRLGQGIGGQRVDSGLPPVDRHREDALVAARDGLLCIVTVGDERTRDRASQARHPREGKTRASRHIGSLEAALPALAVGAILPPPPGLDVQGAPSAGDAHARDAVVGQHGAEAHAHRGLVLHHRPVEVALGHHEQGAPVGDTAAIILDGHDALLLARAGGDLDARGAGALAIL